MKIRIPFLATILCSIAMFFTLGCSVQAKNPVLKNTKWVCVKEMFVADAGIGTDTHTIEFTSAKECTYTMSWYLPAHPAMYVNPNGKIDMIPASSSETVSKGKWQYRRGVLTITLEDGRERIFDYKEGKLVGLKKYDDGTDMVFEKSDE